jgi:hypothetical protein
MNQDKTSGVAVVVIAQNEEETIERSVRSYYDYVDKILVTMDPHRGFSGQAITPDNTVNILRSIDTQSKIEIIQDDYYLPDGPKVSEIIQRQFSVNHLEKQARWEWIFQIDADEVFLDFPAVLNKVRKLRFEKFVYWRWITLFNILDDGRLLVVVDEDGKPNLERFPLAQSTGCQIKVGREIHRPRDLIFKIVKWRYEGGRKGNDAVLHFSYAKSVRKIREKLDTWSHHDEVDVDAFFDVWLRSKTEWESMHNFHPLVPNHWPRLKAYSEDELRKLYY